MQKYLIALLASLLLAAASILWFNSKMDSAYQTGYSQGVSVTESRFEGAIDAVKATARTETDRLKREREKEYDKLKGEKDLVDKRVSILVGELWKRPKREDSGSACVNPDTGTTQTITGASLPREDAEFLTREAARAVNVQKERDFYYGELQRIYETQSRYADRLSGTSLNTKPVP